MLKIAVCDDDGFETVLISTHIKQYQKLHMDLDIQYSSFQSASDLCAELDRGNDFDIYLLDIIMPGTDGLELGKELRNKNKKGVIIYLTSSKDYALDAFQVHALQYLVKPISLATFCETLDIAIQSIDPAHSPLFTIRSAEGTIKIHYSCISYISCHSHTLCFHLSDGKNICSRNIRIPFEEAIHVLLSDSRFIQTHQSYAVNLSYVKCLDNQSFLITAGNQEVEIPIAKRRLSMVKKAYLLQKA